MKSFLLPILLLLCLVSCQPKTKQGAQADDMKLILFIGTYTRDEGHVDGKGKGVYVYEMDKSTGALTYLSTSDPVINPSYLALHPNGKWIYAVNEYEGADLPQGSVSAFNYNPTDQSLTLQNKAVTAGQYPCHLTIDNTGKFVMVANYGGGTVAVLPINQDGSLGNYSSSQQHLGSTSHPRQEAPHAHQIVQHPNQDFVVAVDLGANKVFAYELDTVSGILNGVDDYLNSAEMAGPRHMVFHPTLEIAYVLNELTGTIDVTTISNSPGNNRTIQSIPTSESQDEKMASSAAIKVHPNGRFLYASNRGDLDDIAIFSIDANGELQYTGSQSTLGESPRDFEIDPSGKFLLAANQDSGTIVTFSIDQVTGLLINTGLIAQVPTPVCIKFLD